MSNLSSKELLDELKNLSISINKEHLSKSDKIQNYSSLLKTPYYEVLYNPYQYRLSHKIKDSWNNDEIGKRYLGDLEALKEFFMENPVNSMIIDVRDLYLGHTDFCKEAQKEAQRKLLKMNAKYICLLISSKNLNDITYVEKQHKETGVKINAMFYNFDTADNWLDAKKCI
jgi:hypothetical protein